jgi:hypothetical protein
MDLKDVNKINYNNYYVGQNLDFLIRSKMRSESLSTPLTNTPVYYDDQVSAKMALLGKRGFYDPGYIYGFENDYQKNPQNNSYEINQKQLNEKIKGDGMNIQLNNNFHENKFNNRNEIEEQNNKDNYYNYIKQNNYNPQNNNAFDDNRIQENDEFKKEYYNYINNENKIVNDNESNYALNNSELKLPKTREQIQHEVFIENFKNQQLAKQMIREEEMKYKQNLFRK